MAVTYTLRFKNRSGSQHDFLCYQQGIAVNAPDGYTLAWFAKPLANGTDVDLSWMIDYGFVWSDQGTLRPGVIFNAQQTVPADLTGTNVVTLSDVGGVLQFGAPQAGGSPGTLTITCDSSVPRTAASIGIGMSGQGTHVIPAEPNFAAVFSIRPEYWISFGSFVPGQVLDVATIENSAEVGFPANVYGMTATLDSGNNWTLQQGLV